MQWNKALCPVILDNIKYDFITVIISNTCTVNVLLPENT